MGYITVEVDETYSYKIVKNEEPSLSYARKFKSLLR